MKPSEHLDDRKAYWEKRLRADYGVGGVGYIGLGEGFNRWSYRVRRHVLRRTVCGLDLPVGASILDVGSGTGFMIEVWRDGGFESIEGSDLTAVAVEGLAREFPSCRFREVDISSEQVPYEQEFDAVSANDVLFHIVDDDAYRRSLSNVFRALKPGGYFVFSENFLHGRTLRSEHQVSRSLDEINDMLHQTGFRTIARRPLFVLMNNPIDSSSWVLQSSWRILKRALRRPRFGAAIGAVLYGPELGLVRTLREGPSSEVMVCRRP